MYKADGSEFILGKDWGQEVQGFPLDEIDKLKFHIKDSGQMEISYDPDCTWPTVLDYIEKAGFPIPFKLFKIYD